MMHKTHRIYVFGECRLDVGERQLSRNGQSVALQPKAFDLLTVFVENAGRLMDKDDLLRAVWPDVVVEEVNLANNVSILRKALGESETERFIETVPRRGYRFVGNPVRWPGDAPEEAASVRVNGTQASGGLRESPVPVGLPVRNRVGWRFIGVSIGILAVLILAAVMYRRPSASFVSTGSAERLFRLTSDAGLATEPALSPDGSLLVYASDRSGRGDLDIWIQPLNGSEPLRLTHDEADEREPSFSPDGGRVVYRSEVAGGGIYVVPVLGGKERLLVKGGGKRPRFSPDGKYIAYWTGSGTNLATPGANKIFVVPAAGGEPRQLQADFMGATLPVWSPDSKKILFLGIRETGPHMSPPDGLDWWVTPLGDGPAVKVEARSVFDRDGVRYCIPSIWVPGRNVVLFSARAGDSRNLWQMEVSPETGKAFGQVRRLTFGTEIEGNPMLAGNRLVFSSEIQKAGVWALAMKPDGMADGTPQSVFANSSPVATPYLGRDGRVLVFSSARSGNRDIWLKDLNTGNEIPLTDTPADETSPVLSPDGSRVAFVKIETFVGMENGGSSTYVAGIAGGSPAKLCAGCGVMTDWSPDGKKLLSHGGQSTRTVINSIDVASGNQTAILSHPEHSLYQAQFSADGQWITFLAQIDSGHRQLFVVPSKGEGPLPESNWIAVTTGEYSDDKPRFSDDGKTIYFTSDRDGFLCLWAQALDPGSKRPVGSPVPIHHLHSARQSMRNILLSDLGISAAADRMVFNIGELTGNIWMAELE